MKCLKLLMEWKACNGCVKRSRTLSYSILCSRRSMVSVFVSMFAKMLNSHAFL